MLVHINIQLQQVLQFLKIGNYNICPEGSGHEPHGPGAGAQLQHRPPAQRVGPIAGKPGRFQVFRKDNGSVPNYATHAAGAILLQPQHRAICLLQNPHEVPHWVLHGGLQSNLHCCPATGGGAWSDVTPTHNTLRPCLSKTPAPPSGVVGPSTPQRRHKARKVALSGVAEAGHRFLCALDCLPLP